MDGGKTPVGEQQGTVVKKDLCPLAFTVNIIGSKWALPTIWLLSNNKTMRFNALRRCLDGITNFMLTQTLKTLEQYDIVTRIQYNEIPPRVEYSLSENGETLLPILAAAADWGRGQQERYRTMHPEESESALSAE